MVRIPLIATHLWGPVDLNGYTMKTFVEADAKTLAPLWADSSGAAPDLDTAIIAKRRVTTWIAAVLNAVNPVTSFRE
jgi:hypothetical protein